jgi:hypothetical protein
VDEARVENHLRERLVKIGAKVVSHGRYVTFQMAVGSRLTAGFDRFSRLAGRDFALPTPVGTSDPGPAIIGNLPNVR